jgi:hypothetical protein
MKQSKNVRPVAELVGDGLLRAVQGGGTPLPARRGPLEGTPLPAGPQP